ncbi:MAG: ACT domain-containing protein [Candidatus Lokiarchaeota archaeon]|nr:ACT domain-containing protein [Candidatus Lokiarchaeota archaeon]MBD3200042.1 ACT domain-containing protein [Candidatus Lokiarchaeota archaeon]
MMIKQISVFLENTPGILSRFTSVLMKNNINIRAITVAETADFGILRMIVDRIEDCVQILRENNYLVSVTNVLAVDIPDKPGALHDIAEILGEHEINIEYIYSSIAKNEAVIIFRVGEIEKALKILKDKDIKLLGSNEF